VNALLPVRAGRLEFRLLQRLAEDERRLMGFFRSRDTDSIEGMILQEQNVPHWGDSALWNLALGAEGYQGWEVEESSISTTPRGAIAVIRNGLTRVSVSIARGGRDSLQGTSWITATYRLSLLEGDEKIYKDLRKRIARRQGIL
jgi:hypothetical protein